MFPVPDQKAITLVKLLVEEVVPFFGVPEALLSDRGTNLLSLLMQDVCRLLGVKKLNTTAYHPQCDGMVERFNRTLKAMLRKHASTKGTQWDRYLSSVLWAYQNTPHESTGEKPSFLLFGYDCRTPTEAALLPPASLDPTTVADYREQLVLSLSTARALAVDSIKQAQGKYKRLYDRKSAPSRLKVGDWVLVRFPQEEVGKMRKLSRPWHGPYRIVTHKEPDVTVVKVYRPQDTAIRVHLSRVAPCPSELPPGFYWYGRSDILLDVLLSGSTTYWPKEQTSPSKWLQNQTYPPVNESQRKWLKNWTYPLANRTNRLRVTRRLMLSVPQKILSISRPQLKCQENTTATLYAGGSSTSAFHVRVELVLRGRVM